MWNANDSKKPTGEAKMDKDQALEEFSRSRTELLESIDGLAEQQMTQQPVEGSWTIKDLLAHLESWERTLLTPLANYTQSGKFTPEVIPDDLVWNDQQAENWRMKSLQTVISELHDTRREILEQVSKLNPAQWEVELTAPWRGRGTLADLIAGLSWHENEHLESIHNWIKKNRT
jgi:hypothetical protein